MNRNSNWLWGLAFVLAAILLLIGQFLPFLHFSPFTLLVTLLLIIVLIQSIPRRNFFGIFLPVAVLYLIYDRRLHLPRIEGWQLLIAAVLLAVGCSMLFGRKPAVPPSTPGGDPQNPYAAPNPASYGPDGGATDTTAYFDVLFSSSSQYLHASALRSGQFKCTCGNLILFFDQVTLAPEGAEIFLNVHFGEIVLYIPRTWTVVDNLVTTFGGVKNKVQLAAPQPGGPRLTLSGNVNFASVDIRYI